MGASQSRWPETKKYKYWRTWKADFRRFLLDEPTRKRSMGSMSQEIYERFYFRGHGDSTWKLQPTFDRRNRLRRRKKNEQANKLVRRFVDQASKFEKLEYKEDDPSVIAVAQHHGLPTRLLDWSASPYIAAFFAFSDRVSSENFKGDVSIWALDTGERDATSIVTDDCKFFRLSDHSNVRMGNQQGAFTLLDSDEHDLRQFLSANNQIRRLKQFLVPAHQAVEALDDLLLMGIHRAALFPDREGAATHVDMLSRLEHLRPHLHDDGRIKVKDVMNPA